MPCFAGEVQPRLPLAEPRIIFLNSLCLGPCSFVSDFRNDDQEGRTRTVYTCDAVEICEVTID